MISKRRPFKVKSWSRSQKQSIKRGLEKVETELDVVNFVKQLTYLKIMMSSLFSPSERYLIRKNKKLTLNKRDSKIIRVSSDDDD